MSLNVILPLLTTIVSFIFALTVFDQFLRRRKPYLFAWTLGLLAYGISAGIEFLGNQLGWNVSLYRWWYLIGAFFVAAYLGMGTTYLLVPRRYAHGLMALLILGSVYAGIKVFGAEVDITQLPSAANEAVSGKGLPGDVRVMTPFFNIFGAGALVLGALYSAWIFYRKRILGHRVYSNVLIALGAFIPSIAGGLSRFGMTQFLSLGELLGVVVIFCGFLVSIEIFEKFHIPFTGVTLSQRRR